MTYRNFLRKVISAVFIFSCISCSRGPSKEAAPVPTAAPAASAVPQKPQEPISPLVQPFTAAATAAAVKPELAGEFFNTPVPMANYYFAKRAVATFSAPWRGTPQTLAELEDMTWQELLLSYEAFRRNIEVAQQEVDDEIDKTLQADKVTFKWKRRPASV